MTDKRIVTRGQMIDFVKNVVCAYKKAWTSEEDLVDRFLKDRQPVEFLDRAEVEGICRRMVKRAMKVALGDKRWGNQTVEKYVDAILSLAIPQPDEDKICTHSDKETEAYCENLQREIAYLNDELKYERRYQ